MPMTPSGIEPATFRFVAQYLNHCATAVLSCVTVLIIIIIIIIIIKLPLKLREYRVFCSLLLRNFVTCPTVRYEVLNTEVPKLQGRRAQQLICCSLIFALHAKINDTPKIVLSGGGSLS
jgi:hypothetical protein